MAKFAWAMARARFNYDRGADRIARRLAEQNSLPRIAEKLRDRAGAENLSKQFPPEMTTTDVTIHLQDIRRPLGLGTDVDPHIVNTVLDFLTTHKQGKAVVKPIETCVVSAASAGNMKCVQVPVGMSLKKAVKQDKKRNQRWKRNEIMFGPLKDWRRMATRSDRCPEVFSQGSSSLRALVTGCGS